MAHTWLYMSHEYDGLKHVSKTTLVPALELLHANDPPNMCCPCRDPLSSPAEQTRPTANDPQSADRTAGGTIRKIPTDQISQRQSYDAENAPDPFKSMGNDDTSLMNLESQIIPRTCSPTQNADFGGIQTPYSVDAPPPYLNQSTNAQPLEYPSQATVVGALYATLFDTNASDAMTSASAFGPPHRPFPPQFNNGNIQIPRTLNGSAPAEQGRWNLPQQPRKDSYAEVLRKGLQRQM